MLKHEGAWIQEGGAAGDSNKLKKWRGFIKKKKWHVEISQSSDVFFNPGVGVPLVSVILLAVAERCPKRQGPGLGSSVCKTDLNPSSYAINASAKNKNKNKNFCIPPFPLLWQVLDILIKWINILSKVMLVITYWKLFKGK